jgi:hypothetical protein
MPQEPNSVELKCYYFRARLAEGDQLAAWEGAERLWVHGKSRPKQCDPLFNAWLKAGQLSDDVVWARLLKAFDARQESLMKYVARKASPDLQPWADTLLAVYARPDRIQRQTLPAGSPFSASIASHGLARRRVTALKRPWNTGRTTGDNCSSPRSRPARSSARSRCAACSPGPIFTDCGCTAHWSAWVRTSSSKSACAGRWPSRTGRRWRRPCPCCPPRAPATVPGVTGGR